MSIKSSKQIIDIKYMGQLKLYTLGMCYIGYILPVPPILVFFIFRPYDRKPEVKSVYVSRE